jgi:hypothetical protein
MKTGVLTDPYGNAIATASGGSAPAIDANHIYVYGCTEAAGSTVLVNTGSGANGNLTIQGTQYTDYFLSSKAIGRNAKSFRNLNLSGVGGAWSGTSCSITGGSATIEAFVKPNCLQAAATSGTIIACYGATTANDFLLIETTGNDSSYRAVVNIAGTAQFAQYFTVSNDAGGHHLMASYNGTTGTLNVYVDGALETTATYGSAHSLATMITMVIGNTYSSTTTSYRGWITQARFSNIARSVSYAATTTETLVAM